MFNEKLVASLSGSSFIRKMFEEGDRLRKIYGEDNVYDFSIGNPEMDPPAEVMDALKDLVLNSHPGLHGYMSSNAGFYDVRKQIAEYLTEETGVKLGYENIIMSCGAAGGLNVVLKTILNPGEEIIVISPFFVEYKFYIGNYDGIPVIVPANKDTFEPDLNELEKHLSPKTKGIIINSPNNPTGVVYSEEILRKMADLLEAKEKEYGTSIYVISDEPYNRLVYDNVKVPSVLSIFKNSIVVNSYSKSLALAGERIGYIAVNNSIEDVQTLISGLIFSTRTLGFVNAPAIFQKVAAAAHKASVDVETYKKKRDILYNHLTSLGFECVKPQGTFYMFPKSLIPDDLEFVKAAAKYNLLLVPGSGFNCPGHVRIAYCVSMKTIENSLPAFEKLAKEFK